MLNLQSEIVIYVLCTLYFDVQLTVRSHVKVQSTKNEARLLLEPQTLQLLPARIDFLRPALTRLQVPIDAANRTKPLAILSTKNLPRYSQLDLLTHEFV